ncbi:hypothetical protein ACHWQZ_G015977 [Mnemiopsis leidyi]
MPVTVRTTKSFIPNSYRYKTRRQDEEEGSFQKFSQYIPSRLLVKLGKVVLIVGITCLAVLLGQFVSNVLKSFAKISSDTETLTASKQFERPLRYAIKRRDQKVERLNSDRITKIRQQCTGSEKSEPKVLTSYQKKNLYSRIFVDHKHRFAYCSVPKAACTKWKQILLKSSEIPLYENEDIETIFPHWDHQFKRLSDLDTIKALQVLDQYYTFTFVRDPLVRLVSAWRDKFQHHSNENRSDYVSFHQQYGRAIIKKFRRSFTQEELDRGFPVTFTEYISYITSFKNVEEMNEHWIPATTICRPCHVTYNFVGKFENQKEESEYLINKLNLNNYVPDNFFRQVGNSSREEAKVLLGGVSEERKRILVKFYRDDAAFFGYDLNEFLRV